MGYYTNYWVSIYEGQNDTARLEEIDEFLCDDSEGPGLERDYEDWYGEVKWYDYEDNMYELSLRFPDNLFYVHGDGDDSDDLWDDYWKDGMYQHCHMTIPPFDPKQMKPLRPRPKDLEPISESDMEAVL